MSVRARLNLVWVYSLVGVTLIYALMFVFRSYRGDPLGFGNFMLILEAVALVYSLGMLVYFDFFRLSRPRRGRFAPDLCKVPKNRPPWFYFHANDAPKEYYLLHYYAHVCSLSSLLAGVAGVEFIRGGSVILSHTLMVFAYLSLFYILWRLRTCWMKIYLR